MWLVTAYHYGWLDYDEVELYQGVDIEYAIAVALAYYERRGGKYGVMIEGEQC